MVLGFTGLMFSVQSSHADATGEQTERLGAGHTRNLRLRVEQPDLVELAEALADLREQRAARDGTTTWSGVSQPSCSAGLRTPEA